MMQPSPTIATPTTVATLTPLTDKIAAAEEARRLDVAEMHEKVRGIFATIMAACTARATRTECRLLATGSASGAFSICACTFTVKMACGTSASEVLGHEPTDMADGPRTWLMRIPNDAWVPRVLVADSTDVGGVRSAGQCEARQRRRDSGGVRSSAKFTLDFE